MTTSPISPLSVSPLSTVFGAALPTLPVDEAPFPRYAADLEDNGWPWFPLHSNIPGEGPLWRPTPTLPVGYVWADAADMKLAPAGVHYLALDEDVLTELLYGAPLSRGVHTRGELAQAVEGRLYAYRCRVEPRPDHNARQPLAQCHEWARQLIGGAA